MLAEEEREWLDHQLDYCCFYSPCNPSEATQSMKVRGASKEKNEKKMVYQMVHCRMMVVKGLIKVLYNI